MHDSRKSGIGRHSYLICRGWECGDLHLRAYIDPENVLDKEQGEEGQKTRNDWSGQPSGSDLSQYPEVNVPRTLV